MNTIEIINELRKNNIFPSIEGDQLKLSGETNRLPDALLQRIKESKNELIDFLREPADDFFSKPIPKVSKKEIYETTNAQKRIWTLSQFEGGAEAYNIVTSLYLKGKINIECLDMAFNKTIQRHESLRTIFKAIDGELYQEIVEEVLFKISYKDISQDENINQVLLNEIEVSSRWKFDLTKELLIRVDLIKINTDEYAMIFGVHHIVSDGWSINILISEVLNTYKKILQGQESSITPLRIQYKDYTYWLTDLHNGEKNKISQAFWKNEIGNQLLPLELPYDFRRPEIKSYEGMVSKFYFEKNLYSNIKLFCKENKVTLFNFFRSTLNILLYKYSGNSKIVIGTPVSGRMHYDLEDQIGVYINTLPLIFDLDTESSFINSLKAISENSFKALQYQDYPFEKILDDLEYRRDPSRNPLFDVMMVLQDTSIGTQNLNNDKHLGFELNYLDSYLYESGKIKEEARPAKCDLTFNFDREPDDVYFLEVEYSTQLFKKDTIIKIFNVFENIIRQVLENPQSEIRSIQTVNKKDKEELLTEWNQPIKDITENNIFELLEKSFEENAQKTAILFKNKRISYQDLYDNILAVGFLLDQRKKDGTNSFVGLLLGRTEWTIATIIGILKSGMTYVPVDVKYPKERINYILNDVDPSFLIVDNEGKDLIPQDYKGEVIHIDDIKNNLLVGKSKNKEQIKLINEKAYLIYTSGSTGRPKGVEITHKNVVAFLMWSAKEFGKTPFQVMYASTSYCFDLSVFEFLYPIFQGKTIRILESALGIPEFLAEDEKIFINTVPSVVKNLLEIEVNWSQVVALNMAGESIPSSIIEKLVSFPFEIRNLYGPSEDTTYSTVYKFEKKEKYNIPIGKPIENTHIYILDRDQNLVPKGVLGEIYLSGAGVARGYFNRPELTEEKFVPNPFLPNMKMYKTGDIGKLQADGNIMFLGRIDDQVKIRGNRIELGEIKFVLESHPSFKEVVIDVYSKNDEEKIIVYWVAEDTIKEEDLKIKEYLKEKLPSYMVPDIYIQIENIPLNTNGKVDKSKLPDPFLGIEAKEIVLPQNDIQKKIWSAWKETLEIDELGIHENFFDLGGHSLKAVKLKYLIFNYLSKEITLNEIFLNPTIEGQYILLKDKKEGNKIVFPKVPVNSTYPISFSQERLWVLTNFEEASKAYNMPAAFDIKGNLNLELLESAFRAVIERYEILRTVFKDSEEVPSQSIMPFLKESFFIEKISMEKEMTDQEIKSFLQEKWEFAFDLKNGPLLNSFILITPNRYIFSFNMHHIISDGWSMDVLSDLVFKSYINLCKDEFYKLPEIDFQYKDFSFWQRSLLESGGMEKEFTYWQAIFKETTPVLDFPTDFYRPDVKTYNGDTLNYQFSDSFFQKLKRLTSSFEISSFMALMAGVNVLLKKYSNQNEIIIGTPVSGREFQELENQIGLYVNTLAIKTVLDGNLTFSDLLATQKTIILNALENQNIPFELLVEKLYLERDLSRSPLFDVMVVFQNELISRDNIIISDSLEFNRIIIPTKTAKYDMTFSFKEKKEGLFLELEYNTDLFKSSTINQIVEHLVKLFDQVFETPKIKIKDIAFLSKKELEELSSRFDKTNVIYDSEATIVSLFKKMVKLYPDKTAVQNIDKSISYKELDIKSDQLAQILVDEYQVFPEDFVCLHFERTEWMLIAILAVLKSGAAYVPIDVSYPDKRIDFILEDSNSKHMLYDVEPSSEILENWKSVNFINVLTCELKGEGTNVLINENNLAYVIYTSGTTGNPKGVMIEHKNVNRLLFNEEKQYDFNSSDVWPLFHSYCFDVSVWEMYGALLNGGTLIIVPKETAQDSLKFYDLLRDSKITILNQTPTAFRSLAQNNKNRFFNDPLHQIRYLIFAGEALKPEILKEWHEAMPNCKIINMYGITETTVHVTYKEITSKEIIENKSVIGVPLPTLSYYILDMDLQQVHTGVIGELYVGGYGLARGYLNKPELTSEKFIEHPENPNEKLYRSGDFARILSSGEVEYIGRKDEQIKIRGHRIEIDEIESVISKQDFIEDVIVIPIKGINGDFDLVAYYIANNDFEKQHLKTELNKALPAYMIPTYLISLKEFPLNRNGKLDKTALPKPEEALDKKENYVEARNKLDQELIIIWQEILNITKIGITDNFFDLGGHSLKATRVIAKIQESYGIKIDLKDLFKDPTIKYLSEYIETIQWMKYNESNVTKSEGEIIF